MKNTVVRSIHHSNDMIDLDCSPFWDGVNFNRGVSTPRENWKGSRLREPGQMQVYVKMLGEFIRANPGDAPEKVQLKTRLTATGIQMPPGSICMPDFIENDHSSK